MNPKNPHHPSNRTTLVNSTGRSSPLLQIAADVMTTPINLPTITVEFYPD